MAAYLGVGWVRNGHSHGIYAGMIAVIRRADLLSSSRSLCCFVHTLTLPPTPLHLLLLTRYPRFNHDVAFAPSCGLCRTDGECVGHFPHPYMSFRMFEENPLFCGKITTLCVGCASFLARFLNSVYFRSAPCHRMHSALFSSFGNTSKCY